MIPPPTTTRTIPFLKGCTPFGNVVLRSRETIHVFPISSPRVTAQVGEYDTIVYHCTLIFYMNIKSSN